MKSFPAEPTPPDAPTRPAAPAVSDTGIFDHPYVKRLEREVEEFKGKFEGQVRRTEQVLETANRNLIELARLANPGRLCRYLLNHRRRRGDNRPDSTHGWMKLGGNVRLYARLKLEGLKEAPCQFAVFADPATTQGHSLGRLTMPVTIDYSVVMAIHTLWLVAHTEGLGLGWVSIIEPNVVVSTLNVPME